MVVSLFWPRPSYAYDGSGWFVAKRWIRLRCDDCLHGVVEGQPEDLHEEVDGVAGSVAFGPTPVAVFHDETGEGGYRKVVGRQLDQRETAFCDERSQRCFPRVADLLARPGRELRGFSTMRWIGHSLCANAVARGRG